MLPAASANAPTPRSEFWAGSRGMFPLVVGAIPFGILFGTLASQSGLSVAGTLAMSLFVFAGSAQFIALGLIAAATPLPLIWFTTLVVNLRHLLYALSLLPHVGQLSGRWRLLIGFWLTDESFAVAIARYNQSDASPLKHWYYLGAAVFMYSNWQLCTALGIWLGQKIPDATSWGLDFAMSVTFIGMVVPYVITVPMLITVFVSGSTALLAHGLPHQLGLLVAALSGVAAGFMVEKLQKEKS
jgi:4-azaleucine resistance transporter AzlC